MKEEQNCNFFHKISFFGLIRLSRRSISNKHCSIQYQKLDILYFIKYFPWNNLNSRCAELIHKYNLLFQKFLGWIWKIRNSQKFGWPDLLENMFRDSNSLNNVQRPTLFYLPSNLQIRDFSYRQLKKNSTNFLMFWNTKLNWWTYSDLNRKPGRILIGNLKKNSLLIVFFCAAI